MKNFHAFCIAAPRSGEGKTTISLALMRLLTRQKKCVQAFKCGPDYIDPTFHSLVTSRTCANLDTWMMGKTEVQRVFSTKSHDADISICEGVMGLFDGKIQGKENLKKENQIPNIDGSSAHCAKILNIPIILVVNAKGMASSIAALVAGFVLHAQKYNLTIAGIIANNVGSARHAKILEDALSTWDLPPLLGFLPRQEEWSIHERQLGLVPCEESEKNMAWANSIADILEENLDVDTLLKRTQTPRPLLFQSGTPAIITETLIPTISPASSTLITASPLAPLAPLAAKKKCPSHSPTVCSTHSVRSASSAPDTASPHAKQTKGLLAIARDEAFCFYYEANIKALEHIGWKIIYFSPLHDKHLPKADALYLGGGYPEVFAKQLAENQNMRNDIYNFAMKNGEIFAECGGYMYLTKELIVQNSLQDNLPNKCIISNSPLAKILNKTSSKTLDTTLSISVQSTFCNGLSSNRNKHSADHSTLPPHPIVEHKQNTSNAENAKNTENTENDTIRYPMCGVINGVACMGKKMRSLGYREIDLHANTVFHEFFDRNSQKITGAKSQETIKTKTKQITEASSEIICMESLPITEQKKSKMPQSIGFRGHEFHWSDIELQENYPPLASVNGIAYGVTHKNVRASYLHFYWANSVFAPQNNK